jgi:oxygen-dependent protoporphyrinogen oxidase
MCISQYLRKVHLCNERTYNYKREYIMKKIAVIGGGISGLTIAYLLLNKKPELDITVYEADNRPGGKIWTEQADGYLCERGPNGFLDNKPMTLELCESLGIEPVRSNENSKKRFIFSGGKLNALPESPSSFIKSGLLSWPGKIRLIGELIAPKGPVDETVAAFITRRLGKEALEKLIDPMCSGVYAGDPSGGNLTSFYNGAQTITDTLAQKIGERLRLSVPVQSISMDNSRYQVHTANETLDADIVVMAPPAYASSVMLKDFDSELSKTLSDIPYPHVAVVCFGYKKENLAHPLNGFGFLVPHNEGRQILGTLWDSSIFPNRASGDTALLRTMIGGAKNPQMADLNDDKISDIVFDELKPLLGLKKDPDMLRVFRWEKAIPQYIPGHIDKLNIIEKHLKKYPGLYLTGNSYRGIGINDCVKSGYEIADKILLDIEQ